MPSKSLHKLPGSLKQLIAQVGINKATALIRTSLPPCDNVFSFQVFNFVHTLYFIFEKAFLFALPMIEGRPKYLSYCYRVLWDQRAINSVFVWLRVFLLNTIAVLFELMHCPKADSYFASKDCTFLIVSTLTLQKITLSSANNKLLMKRSPLDTLMPRIWPSKEALDNKLARLSIQSINR